MPRIKPYESQVSSQGDLPSRSAGVQDFGGAGLSNLGQGLEILDKAQGRHSASCKRLAHARK
jgi:hypothetical protein